MSAAQSNPSKLAETNPRLPELLDQTQETARGILEAEDALRLMRQRFEDTQDPAAQGEIAAGALDQVDRQLKLTRERRRQLDVVEVKLWARRNRIERFLIHTRGRTWWHTRNRSPQTETAGNKRDTASSR